MISRQSIYITGTFTQGITTDQGSFGGRLISSCFNFLLLFYWENNYWNFFPQGSAATYKSLEVWQGKRCLLLRSVFRLLSYSLVSFQRNHPWSRVLNLIMKLQSKQQLRDVLYYRICSNKRRPRITRKNTINDKGVRSHRWYFRSRYHQWNSREFLS